MNRFLLAGLLLEAACSPKLLIGYVGHTHDTSEALALCKDKRTDHIADVIERVYHAHGQERIVLRNGSQIRFHRTLNATRRARFDVLLIDRSIADRTDLAEMRSYFATCGEVVPF